MIGEHGILFRIDPTNHEVIAILLKNFQPSDDYFNIAFWLVRFDPGKPHGVAALAELIRGEPVPAWQSLAMEELAKAGAAAKAAVPALKAVAAGSDPGARKAALRALWKIAPEAVPK